MSDADLKKQMNDLQLRIEKEEANYKTAIISHVNYNILKEMRSNIRKLKNDLQDLMKKKEGGKNRFASQ